MKRSDKSKDIDQLIDELVKEHQGFWDNVKDKRVRDLTRDELREYVSMCLEGMIKVCGDVDLEGLTNNDKK